MLKELSRIFHTELFQLGCNVCIFFFVSLKNFKESLSALLCFQSNLTDNFVAVVISCFAKKNVSWFCKNATANLSACIFKVTSHAFFISLEAFNNAVHAGNSHCKAAYIVSNKALACRVCKVTLMFRNLIHIESNYARAHCLPQRFNVLAVPRVSLLRHCRATYLSCCKVLEYFANFASLEVAKVISKISNNTKGNIHLKQKSQNIFRLNKLV